jgi:beta-glucosidase
MARNRRHRWPRKSWTTLANAAVFDTTAIAVPAASAGSGTITYTDGTTQQFTIGFGDWASTTPYSGSQVAVTSAYGNTATGTSPWKASVFYDAVTLQAGKTVQSVTLPNVTAAPLHVFAAAIG